MNLNIRDFMVYFPSKNFEESKRFYKELGFTLSEGWGGTADFTLGPASFRLQDYYVKDWANNMMFKIGVDDAHAWYEHAAAVAKNGGFETVRIKPPEKVDDSLVTHVHDPAGVLLVFVQ